ncbi:MAG: hypothetical protein A2Z16_06870 [Chloroflexi bacterium RBG_16_54_18]|nr:MAG: hypothetical protein A2Z16_06870 [Chloroflexi bacterium RBG_16_54_18]
MKHSALPCSLVSSLLVLSACTQGIRYSTPGTAPEPEISAENFPKMDGSTSAEPILAQIACTFLDVPCQWVEWLGGDRRLAPELTNYSEDFPNFGASGTHQAYMNLIEGRADLILVAREPSQDELRLSAGVGKGLDIQPVALDAFVFIVNEDNPVSGLSTPQIQEIYTGRLTNWQSLGGIDAEIHPFQRDENSGSQELMRKLVMGNLRMVDAPDLILLSMFAPFYAVSDDPYGISYSVFYYEENMAPQDERVKLVAVDGVMPDQDSIRQRKYPYTTDVYAVLRSDLPKDSLAHQLRDWLLSSEGQVLIEESGYVPRY